MPHQLLKSRRAWAAACLLLLVLWLVSSAVARVTAWGAVWEREEYRFTFRDRAGRPVQGVRLRVENRSGTNFYHFPVTDYLPGRVPTSDDPPAGPATRRPPPTATANRPCGRCAAPTPWAAP